MQLSGLYSSLYLVGDFHKPACEIRYKLIVRSLIPTRVEKMQKLALFFSPTIELKHAIKTSLGGRNPSKVN